MKKLLKILDATSDYKLDYNFIVEVNQVRIELFKKNNYINNFVITDDSEIFINFDGKENFSEVSTSELLNYFKNI